jgi:hypothetical protein
MEPPNGLEPLTCRLRISFPVAPEHALSKSDSSIRNNVPGR